MYKGPKLFVKLAVPDGNNNNNNNVHYSSSFRYANVDFRLIFDPTRVYNNNIVYCTLIIITQYKYTYTHIHISTRARASFLIKSIHSTHVSGL